jgi:2-polyprenyl-6-hydroxyphenyl methylase/3-demethylubiquinone-9 3-methyltransferase
MWAQGDYAAVARLLEPYAVRLAGLCNIGPGMNVLDVAAGNGNFALAAVGQGANVTACDLTPRMIEMGRARSEAARQDIEWIEGDAEALPVPDASFDLVASVFGAMFAPQPQLVASELFRVCRSSGLVAMANYAPEGFLGSMSALFASYSNPLPYEVPSPFEWGDSAVVKRRFDTLAREVEIQPDTLTMRFESVDAGMEFWERTNAPTIALRMTLPAERYVDFQRDARKLMEEMNASRDGRLELESSYVMVLARPVT